MIQYRIADGRSDKTSQHEQVSQAVRDWFRLPFEGMGYRCAERFFGAYWSTGMVYPNPAGIMRWIDDPLDIWIRGLAVRPAFPGQGIGSALVTRAQADGHSAGCRSMLINVALQNSGARRLYGRLGFRDEVYRRCQFASPPKRP